MELINQHTKKIMEDCKIKAREAGLKFDAESLEYIVTNRDLIELSPKVMIPTLYDYWANDVEIIKNKAIYKVYPSNPYETVINSRPAISYYNDNNPDWLNVMIFYHVLGHIDFFQNNSLFLNTWNDDFVGQALADKRLLNSLRLEYKRWVDYVIEFSKGIDNLCRYFPKLSKSDYNNQLEPLDKINFYFNTFLQEIEKVPEHTIFNEIGKYNEYSSQNENVADSLFLADIRKKYPEFDNLFEKKFNKEDKDIPDVLEFIRDNSPFLRKEENHWMKSVMTIIRNTAMYFEPQIRSKIINEGWASYWHDNLFIRDERIVGHESEYANINAKVTSLRRIGLNPYAIGLRLIQYVEELADKGKINYYYQKIENAQIRENYDKKTNKGKETIFNLRKIFSDFTLINTFVDQDFVDMHDLFVVGKRLNQQKGTIEYYVKSRKAEDYKNMLIDSLYHPPHIEVDVQKTSDENLYLTHFFEGKQLYKDYINDTLIGIEYLWGGQVHLETTEIFEKQLANQDTKFDFRKVMYSVKDKKVTKKHL
jgi:stage V sporulation protein R